MRRRVGALIAGLALGAVGAVFPAHADCRQALALGLDVSASVDAQEYRLQREGLARALLSPQVMAAFTAVPDIPVALMIFEWSGYRSQSVLVPWTTLRGPAQIEAVADRLLDGDDGRKNDSTALGGAALFAGRAFREVAHCWTRTLDLSGDGKNNDGPTPAMLSDDPALDGVTINGLVIGTDPQRDTDQQRAHIGELVAYFQRHVIRGPGAFTEVALGFEGFEQAMRRKLLREIEVPRFSALPEDTKQLPRPSFQEPQVR